MPGIERSKRTAKTCRLILGFLAPPILGSVLFLMLILGLEINAGPTSIDRVLEYIFGFHLIVFSALIFIGLQSLAYRIIMKFVVRPKIHRLRYFLLVSCILGGFSGLFPGVIVDDLDLFLPMGMLVGIVVGLLIYDKNMAIDRNSA